MVIASHSEVVLDEAARSGDAEVVAFLGKPHRLLQGRAAALRQSLESVRLDQYYLAEQKGWVLYLEGSTDLEVLRAFAKRLNHPAAEALSSPFFVDIGNRPENGRKHFNALSEAKPDITGYLLVDQDAPELRSRENLVERKWRRREIENYLCHPATLTAYTATLGRAEDAWPLFEPEAADKMAEAIGELTPPAALRDASDPFWVNVKASDDYLDRIFARFAKSMGISVPLRKADYHKLVEFVPSELIEPEVVAALDESAEVAARGSMTES